MTNPLEVKVAKSFKIKDRNKKKIIIVDMGDTSVSSLLGIWNLGSCRTAGIEVLYSNGMFEDKTNLYIPRKLLEKLVV